MHVRPIVNKIEWEQFLQSQEFTPFVQSEKYINFYQSLQEQGFILGMYESDTLVGGSVVVTTHAKRGNFLYLPYGPILPQQKMESWLSVLLEFLVHYAKKNQYDFIRMSPFLDDNQVHRALFSSLGFRPAPMHVLAENTWILDITTSEEILLKNMNKNHRNLIRRSEKEGVIVQKNNQMNTLKNLDQMLNTTAQRNNFKRFSQDYIEKEFKSFLPNNVELFESYLPDGRVDSSAIIMFYGNMAAYRHSASLHLDKRFPTSYLLQWRVIQEAKRRGMSYYNFWGIAPESASVDHPFFGITHFKKGFGGFKKDLLHCQDYVVNKKYWINWTIETFRRFNRGF